MEQVAQPDHERGGDQRAPDQAEHGAGGALDARGEEQPALEQDVGDQRLGQAAEVAGPEPVVARAEAGEAGDRDARRRAVHDGLDDRRRQDQRDPEARVRRVDLAEGAEQAAVDHDRLGRGERGAGGDAEGEAVDHVVELRQPGQDDRAELLEHLAHDRHQQDEDQEAGPADAAGPVAVEVDGREVVAQQAGVPEEREAHAQGGRGPDRAEHDAERLVLPLVDVVHVDDVDGRYDERGRDEREREVAQRAGQHGDQHREAEGPAVGLRRGAGRQRHQRADEVERRHGLAGLEREALPPLAVAGAEQRPGAGVEAGAGREAGQCCGLVVGHQRTSSWTGVRRPWWTPPEPARAKCVVAGGSCEHPSARGRTRRENFRFRPDHCGRTLPPVRSRCAETGVPRRPGREPSAASREVTHK